VSQPPEDTAPADAPINLRETYRQELIKSIGGWQGAVITAIPPIVFVVVNATTSLQPAIWAALGTAALLIAYRLVRREPLQQAVSGAFGVGIAAFIAWRTGEARDYFLPGIWLALLFAVPLIGSMVVRRPAVGLVWEFLDPTPGADDDVPWHRRPPLLRAYMWSTVAWTVATLSRGGVQLALYNRDATGWLAFARIAMGWPLTIAALAVTFLLVTRTRKHLIGAEGSSRPGQSGSVAGDDGLP